VRALVILSLFILSSWSQQRFRAQEKFRPEEPRRSFYFNTSAFQVSLYSVRTVYRIVLKNATYLNFVHFNNVSCIYERDGHTKACIFYNCIIIMVRNCKVAWESVNKGGDATDKKLLPCSIYVKTISSSLDTKIYHIFFLVQRA
jgi:hypothetical protein